MTPHAIDGFFEGPPLGAFFLQRALFGGQYAIMWIVLSLGVWALLALQLWALIKSITAATEQQSMAMLNETRFFLIDHPDLVDRHPDPEFNRFIEETGGLPKYFLRRTIITTLELLYFHRKRGAIGKAFFISHCNYTRPWFKIPAFAATWDRTRSMHTPEFVGFVDMLKDRPAEEIDPWRSLWHRVGDFSPRKQRR